MKPGDKVRIVSHEVPEVDEWLWKINSINEERGVAGCTCIEPGYEGGGDSVAIGRLRLVESYIEPGFVPPQYQGLSDDELRRLYLSLATGKKGGRRKGGAKKQKVTSKEDLMAIVRKAEAEAAEQERGNVRKSKAVGCEAETDCGANPESRR